MKCPRSIPFLHSGLALGAKRHDGFADAWNWLIHSFWHMTMGDGLKWKNKWNGYPKINLAIEAGDGINVKYKSGKVIISTGDGETEDDDYSSGGGGTTSGSDGSDWQDGTATAISQAEAAALDTTKKTRKARTMTMTKAKTQMMTATNGRTSL